MKRVLKLAVGMLAAAGMVACGGAKQETGKLSISMGGVNQQALQLSNAKSIVVTITPTGTTPPLTISNTQMAPITLGTGIPSALAGPYVFEPLALGTYKGYAKIFDGPNGTGTVLFQGGTSTDLKVVTPKTYPTALITVQQLLPGDTVCELSPYVESILISHSTPTFAEKINLTADVDAWNMDCNVGDCYFDKKGGKHCPYSPFDIDWTNVWSPTFWAKKACTFAWGAACSLGKLETAPDVFTTPTDYQTDFTSYCADGVETFTFCVADSASTLSIDYGASVRCEGKPDFDTNRNCPIRSCVSFSLPYTSNAGGFLVDVNTAPDVSCITVENGEPVCNAPVVLNCAAKDKDGDALTYSWSSKCKTGNGTFVVPDLTKGDAIWTAPAFAGDECEITCTASDGTLSTSGELGVKTAPISLSPSCIVPL